MRILAVALAMYAASAAHAQTFPSKAIRFVVPFAAGGGSDLVARAIQAIALEWTQRGPATVLTKVFVDHFVTGDAAHLLERLSTGQVVISTSQAPLVFKVAAEGDPPGHRAGCAGKIDRGEGVALSKNVRCNAKQEAKRE